VFGLILRSPYLWAWIAALLIAALVSAYLLGSRHANDACAAAQLEAVQRAIEQANQQAREDAEVLRSHLEIRERIRTQYKTITREVVRYVETHPDRVQCLDTDGLRLWNAANAGSSETIAGGVRPTVPPAPGRAERQ
jgi:hypothetical protein